MKIAMAASAALMLWSGACAAQVDAYESKGNLAATRHLGCIPLTEVKSEYTPPDLAIAFKACVEAGRYDDAVDLLRIAGAYARFDAMRVPDETSHDAFAVIMSYVELSETDRAKLLDINKRTAARDSPDLLRICNQAKRIGPPNYTPDYMIRHGMGAFFGPGQGVPADFDAKAAWKTLLDAYMHCSVSDL